MAGSLSQYWKKRDFRVTGEPRGEVARPGKSLSFVIQKHAASRLHYDFRLELDGTLKSWAVPKGPSLDPKVRRMAVMTEDHPLSYASFEGVIPQGQYGAGTVIVWDRGTWEPVGDPRAGYKVGKLKFDMHGEKLRGRWNLVRMHGRAGERAEPWLLIKENDDEARPAAEYDIVEDLPDSVLKGAARVGKKGASAPRTRKAKTRSGAAPAIEGIPKQAVKAKLPLALAPQLATLVDAPPKGEGWVYEIKFDGYRIVVRIDGDDVRLFTRNGNNWTGRMPVLHAELKKLGLASAWLDGEVVVLDPKGNPSFQLLQNAFDSSKTKDMVFFVFDLPHFAGYDLTGVPLAERRRVLEAALAPAASPHVRFSETFDAPVEQLLESACRKGLEGLIGKRADAPYSSRRSSAWVKVKCSRRQEFVIAGYTDPRGSRTGFGSLVLGVHDDKGDLVYAGNVGTGFDQAGLRSLFGKLEELSTEKMPFGSRPKGVKAHWVRPKLVAEVAFSEWTSDGRIRHPVFHGLRTDKEPRAITREPVKHVDDTAPAKAAAATGASAAKRGNRNVPMRSPAKATGAKITHPDRVIDPKTGLRKIDLVEYYGKVAKHILPHIAGRPLAFVRAPEGIAGEHFFQKHEMRDKAPLSVTTPEELLGAAQMNMVELHTGNATAPHLDKPDRVVFDLDPGEGISWETLKEATRLTKHVLDLLGLESFLKTSGGKGLHVVVPLLPERPHGEVRDFSERVVQHMAKTLPKLFVAKSGARNRVKRIFVDYLRNGSTATTAAAFTARARPGLGVSVPLAWRELAKLESADQWNIKTLPARLARQRSDPWKAYWKTRQRLDDALRKLG